MALVPPTSLGGDIYTTVTKLADESVTNSVVQQADDELFFATVNGAIYDVQILLIYASPAGAGTPDLSFNLAEDATGRGGIGGPGLSTADVGANTGVATANNVGMTRGTAATNRAAFAIGAYTAAGGNATVFWAQNTADPNPTIVRAGSILRYRRVL